MEGSGAYSVSDLPQEPCQSPSKSKGSGTKDWVGGGSGTKAKCGEMNGYLIRYAKVLDGIPSNITLPKKCG